MKAIARVVPHRCVQMQIPTQDPCHKVSISFVSAGLDSLGDEGPSVLGREANPMGQKHSQSQLLKASVLVVLPAPDTSKRPVARHPPMTATVEMRCPESCIASCNILQKSPVRNNLSSRKRLSVIAS